MIRLVQLQSPEGRRVAVVEEPHLVLLQHCSSVHELAETCLARSCAPAVLVNELASGARLNYDEVYAGASPWRLLPAADHPEETARCMVSGTGLTHVSSAKNRNAMHVKSDDLTDSMRMYMWGVDGGKPAPGEIGVAPEWFYKGTGTCLRAHNEPLAIPAFAEDGGEEPEIAGVYIIDSNGAPRRIGYTQGNEFSDHEFEKRNYLYLAASKLRMCSIGPELVIGAGFASVPGTVTIERGDRELWSRSIATGEEKMSHTVANMEHHHFKFDSHRRPGDVHVHFFGADAFSFGDGVRLESGDVMQVSFAGFGRPLRNPLEKGSGPAQLVEVRSLDA